MDQQGRSSLEHGHVSTEDAQVHISTQSTPLSLSRALHARRAEYTRPQTLRIKIGTWNVAACSATELDLKGWFVDGQGTHPAFTAGVGLRHDHHGRDEDQRRGAVEAVGEQEDRRRKKHSTLPRGDRAMVTGGAAIDLYVLGLQEIVDLASVKEYVGKVYSDSEPRKKWRKALAHALPPGFELVSEQQLSGLLLLIFASASTTPFISNVSSVAVGTGILGYLGNKGAVVTRIVLGETTKLVFINSHLTSGTDPTQLERRCYDFQQILQRTKFDAIDLGGVLDDVQEGIGAEDFAFWFGDLNFRLDKLPGDDVRRILMLHTRGEYDVGQKSREKMDAELSDVEGPVIIHAVDSDEESDSEPNGNDSKDHMSPHVELDADDYVQEPNVDPASLQATLDSLLPHDQLRHVQHAGKAFHDGWRESPITFLPTYKYDIGSMGMFDSSEKKRAPSWCDRILFRARADTESYIKKIQEEEATKRRDEEMTARGIDHAADDDAVLYDYDPDEDGTQESPVLQNHKTLPPETTTDTSPQARTDLIVVESYTSHQRVLSSDHKPLDAVFTISYDGVDPELRSMIQQEIARDLDRAENEGRPDVTIVIEPPQDPASKRSTNDSEKHAVELGDVAYLQSRSRNITIANTSQVTCKFSIVSGSDEGQAGDFPAWLKVCFHGSESDEATRRANNLIREVSLDPGVAVTAMITVRVDTIPLAMSLNKCELLLDHVLVIRVLEGRDHFIPTHATWLQSCFGRSIDELIHVPRGGIRALLPSSRAGDMSSPVNRGQQVTWPAPQELVRLTEAIESLLERAIADIDMIQDGKKSKVDSGWPFLQESWTRSSMHEVLRAQVFEALDSDQPLVESFPVETGAVERIEIIAETLLIFVEGLPDGIVPMTFWPAMEAQPDASNSSDPLVSGDLKSRILDILSSSPNHNISFVFLTSMLTRVVNEIASASPAGAVTTVSSNSALPAPADATSAVSGGLDMVRRSLTWKTGRALASASEHEPNPVEQRRSSVELALARIFAPLVFRSEATASEREKERKAALDRKIYLLRVAMK